MKKNINQKKNAGLPACANTDARKNEKGKEPGSWPKDLKLVADAINATANTGLNIYEKVTAHSDQQDKAMLERNARQFDELKAALIVAGKDGKIPYREQISARAELIATRNTEEMRLRKNEEEIRHIRSKTRLKNAGTGFVILCGLILGLTQGPTVAGIRRMI